MSVDAAQLLIVVFGSVIAAGAAAYEFEIIGAPRAFSSVTDADGVRPCLRRGLVRIQASPTLMVLDGSRRVRIDKEPSARICLSSVEQTSRTTAHAAAAAAAEAEALPADAGTPDPLEFQPTVAPTGPCWDVGPIAQVSGMLRYAGTSLQVLHEWFIPQEEYNTLAEAAKLDNARLILQVTWDLDGASDVNTIILNDLPTPPISCDRSLLGTCMIGQRANNAHAFESASGKRSVDGCASDLAARGCSPASSATWGYWVPDGAGENVWRCACDGGDSNPLRDVRSGNVVCVSPNAAIVSEPPIEEQVSHEATEVETE